MVSKQCPKCRGFDFNTEFRVLKKAPTFRGKKLQPVYFGSFPNVKVNMKLEKATKTADGSWKLFWKCTEEKCGFVETDLTGLTGYKEAVTIEEFTQIDGE